MTHHDPARLPGAFAEAWNRGDADALAALFTEHADFVNVVGFWWTRRRQIRHNHAYGFAHIFAGSTMTLEKVQLRALGDVAVVHARWRITGQGAPTGSSGSVEPGDRRGILVLVAQRQHDGQWLAVAAQNTDIVPEAQTLVADDAGLRPARYDGGGDREGSTPAENGGVRG